MKPKSKQSGSEHFDNVSLYALRALPLDEAAAVEAHIATCADCQNELETLRPLLDRLTAWPTDVLRPSQSLWDRLARRIAAEDGVAPLPAPPPAPKPEWEEAAPGISVKILSSDNANNRVGMLVRLAPGADYPAHRHGGAEELHLLAGELIVDERKLVPGDYIQAAAGSSDYRVWTETGCTCLLITSTKDEIL